MHIFDCGKIMILNHSDIELFIKQMFMKQIAQTFFLISQGYFLSGSELFPKWLKAIFFK